MQLVKPAELISPRARERWRARKEHQAEEFAQAAARAPMIPGHGTVGAIAIDVEGGIAAATISAMDQAGYSQSVSKGIKDGIKRARLNAKS